MSAEDDRLNKIQAEIDRTKGVMKTNIDKTIQRGDKLDSLEDKAENLNTRAGMFRNNARAVNRHFCIRYWRNVALVLVILAVVIVVIYFAVTGGKK